MTTPDQRLSIFKAENRRVEEYLDGIPAERWNQASMCSEWTVADVIAHLNVAFRNRSQLIIEGLDSAAVVPESSPGTTDTPPDPTPVTNSAIGLRQELGDRLFPQYIKTNRMIEHTFSQVGTDGWDKILYRPRGSTSIAYQLNAMIIEVAVHRWDVTYPFGRGTRLSDHCLPVMVGQYPNRNRWWEIELPEGHPPLPVRFRLQATDVDAPGADFIIESDDAKRTEIAGDELADVDFECDSETFMLLVYSRITPESAVESAKLSHDGDAEWADIFLNHFIGG